MHNNNSRIAGLYYYIINMYVTTTNIIVAKQPPSLRSLLYTQLIPAIIISTGTTLYHYITITAHYYHGALY